MGGLACTPVLPVLLAGLESTWASILGMPLVMDGHKLASDPSLAGRHIPQPFVVSLTCVSCDLRQAAGRNGYGVLN